MTAADRQALMDRILIVHAEVSEISRTKEEPIDRVAVGS
jgi:hypothetical protein